MLEERKRFLPPVPLYGGTVWGPWLSRWAMEEPPQRWGVNRVGWVQSDEIRYRDARGGPWTGGVWAWAQGATLNLTLDVPVLGRCLAFFIQELSIIKLTQQGPPPLQ